MIYLILIDLNYDPKIIIISIILFISKTKLPGIINFE